MIDETIAEYVRERMALLDTAVDTSAGSEFDTKVLQPLLRRLGGSALDSDLMLLMQDVIEAEHPDVLVRQGSVLHDLVIRFAAKAVGPILRELRFDRIGNSLDAADSWRDFELDSFLSRFFVPRSLGREGQATLRAFFRAPVGALVTPLTLLTVNTHAYYPTATTSITADGMALNLLDGEYYFDFTVQADAAGELALAVGGIAETDDLQGHVRVEVLSVQQVGVAAQSATEAIARAQESITQRTLTTASGILIVLPSDENFPELGNIVTVGFGDTEMDRDMVYGPVSVSHIPGGILGFSPPSLAAGEAVHIGGKTDVYVQATAVAAAVDIDNVANIGSFVAESTTGYTLTAADGGVDQLMDDRTQFDLVLGDQPGYLSGGVDSTGTGYYVHVGGNEFAVYVVNSAYLRVYTDANSTTKPVAYAPASPDGATDSTGVAVRTNLATNAPNGNVELVAGIGAVPYGVFFRDFRGDSDGFGHARGFIADIPLWRLVAEVAGVPVLDATSGNPIAQAPAGGGAALEDSSGDAVEKADTYFIEDPLSPGTLQQGPNVALTNVAVPLKRISGVAVVDSVSDEVLATLPHGAPVRAVVQEAIAVGSQGTVRLYFTAQASAAVFRDRHAVTALYYGDEPLLAAPLVAYSGAAPTLSTSWSSDYAYVDGSGIVNVAYQLEVDGTTTDLPFVDSGGSPASPAGVADVLRAFRAGDRIVYWRSSSYVDAVVLTIKTVKATSLEVYWPSGTYPPAASGWGSNRSDFAVCQGIRAADMTADSTGYHYVDFAFENAGTVAVPEDAELTWLAESSSDADPVMLGGVHSPVRVEGWRARPHLSEVSFSAYERCALRMTWQVNDDTFLFDPPGMGTNVGSPRLRVSYEHVPALAAVTDFVTHEDNRPLGEEILVRSLLPAFVGGELVFAGTATAAEAKAAVTAYVDGLDPEDTLQVSSIGNTLKDAGATYVRHPLLVSLVKHDRERNQVLEIVTDARTFDRLVQTEVDPDRLSVTS